MSLSSTINKVIYSGNGATIVWPFAFPVLDAGHLGVVFTDSAGLESVLPPGAYGIAGIGDPSGGSVTYPLTGSPIPTGTRLTLLRTVPYTQTTILSNQGAYYPEVVERRFDEIYMALQQLDERVGRASLYALSNPATEQGNLALIQELQPMNALTGPGDLLTRDDAGYRRLARGSAAQFLGVSGSDLAWRDVVLPKMHIHGLTYAKSGANTIDIAAGGCMSDDGTDWISFASLAGVAIDMPFGTGAGSLDGGSISNGDYWIHLIKNPSSGVIKPLTSLSLTGPTMPTGYTKKRVVGWLRRTSGSIVDFFTNELSGGGLHFNWKAAANHASDFSGGIGSPRSVITLRVPVGITGVAGVTAVAYDTTGTNGVVRLSCLDETDAAPTGNTASIPSNNSTGYAGVAREWVRFNTNAQIGARSSQYLNSCTVNCAEFQWSRR